MRGQRDREIRGTRKEGDGGLSSGKKSGPGSGGSPLSKRAWLLALGCQVLVLLWVVRTELTARVFVSSWTLSMPAVILLLALLTWKAARAGRAFGRGELLAAFVAVSSTVTVAGYNFFQVLIPTLGTGMYF